MFGFFKKKTIFEETYAQITTISVVRNCKYYKPIISAYLFVLSDYIYSMKGKLQTREENAKEIFSVVENKLLDLNELSVFDKCVELFGMVVRKAIRVRGDWCFFDGDMSNTIQNLYICAGDLIRYPDSVFNYENAPLVLSSIEDMLAFSTKFRAVLDKTKMYIEKIERG